MRDLGIGDAADVYYALLWDRAGMFDKSQMGPKDDLDRSIAGNELSQLAEVARMRSEMGLAPASAKPAVKHMAEQLDIARKLREEMGLSPKGPPNPG